VEPRVRARIYCCRMKMTPVEQMVRPAEFIHRRVDALRLSATGESMWRSSVDCTLPATRRGTPLLVFLGYAPKEPLKKFDIEVNGGGDASLVLSSENADFSTSCLVGLAAMACGVSLRTSEAALAVSAEALVTCDPSAGSAHLDAFSDGLNQLLGSRPVRAISDTELQHCLHTAELLTHSFAIVAALPHALQSQRAVITYTYAFDPAFSSLNRTSIVPQGVDIPLVNADQCTSYHFELEVPNELNILDLRLTPRRSLTRTAARVSPSSVSIMHAHIPSAARLPLHASADVWVGASHPLTSGTLIAAITTTTLCLLTAGNHFFGASVLSAPVAENTSRLAALPIGLALYLLGWVIRPSEPRLVRTVLRSPRASISMATIILLYVALCLSFSWSSHIGYAVWLTSVIMSSTVSAWCWYTWARLRRPWHQSPDHQRTA
jgi:hypothetical protein